MLTDKQIYQLDRTLKRVFSMPITRSTFREVQNSIVAVAGNDSETSTSLFESLIAGEIKGGEWVNGSESALTELIDNYSVQAKVSKDVYERGEFISVASSDIISQPNRVAFLNRFRRVDGQELHFLTDTKGTVNLLFHLIGRLGELEKNEVGKGLLKECQSEIEAAIQKLQELSS